MRKVVLRMRTPARNQFPLWKQILRPHCLGLIGLGLAVVFLGAAYKLSLYHPHPAPSMRASVVKLWIETRHPHIPAAARRGIRFAPVTPQAISSLVRPLPALGRAAACSLGWLTRRVASLAFLIPVRSPPPHRFLPA